MLSTSPSTYTIYLSDHVGSQDTFWEVLYRTEGRVIPILCLQFDPEFEQFHKNIVFVYFLPGWGGLAFLGKVHPSDINEPCVFKSWGAISSSRACNRKGSTVVSVAGWQKGRIRVERKMQKHHVPTPRPKNDFQEVWTFGRERERERERGFKSLAEIH